MSGLTPLNSPIRHSSYNGAIEHGVGPFKRAVQAALDPDLPVPQIPKLLPLIRAVIHLHNTRPRRSLGGLTPAQAYFHHRPRPWSRARRHEIFDWIRCQHLITVSPKPQPSPHFKTQIRS